MLRVRRDLCAECERACQDKLKPEMDCPHCRTVVLSEDNGFAWHVIQTAGPMLFRPGGVDPAAIGLAFRVCRVDPADEAAIFEKIMAFADEALQAASDK